MSRPLADQLTALHRSKQLEISRAVATQVLEQWGSINPVAIDASWPRVAAALTQIIDAGYAASLQTASAYLRLHAATYGVTLTDLATPAVNADQVATSLRVTGPVALKVSASTGVTPAEAAATAAVQIVGSSTRLALAGGRRMLTDTYALSDVVIGFRRVGDGHSCKFCDMLISRGAVYKTAGHALASSGARGNQRPGHAFHDHCGCTTEPLYAGQDEPAEVAAAFQRYLDTR